ncbi:MAG: tetratricopeptide repeat protein [Comamonas sp.]
MAHRPRRFTSLPHPQAPRLARLMLALATTAAFGLAPLAAQAQGTAAQVQQRYGDIQTLISQQKYAQAIEAADRYLADNPRDPQVRFLKGVAQTGAGDDAAAIETFTALTQVYPELPEPYNNLAAIHARQGDYEKAREALQQALRANPAYAAAHENLGDIYIQLARQQYQAAAERESGNQGVQRKLHQAQQILQP